MGWFAVPNTVLLAILQVGVVVGGVLAAASDRWWESGNVVTPLATVFLMEFGWLGLALPAGGWCWHCGSGAARMRRTG
jgi:hypothetical protein